LSFLISVEPVVSAPYGREKIARIADEGTSGVKIKLFDEFKGLEDLDVKMPFKTLKIEKE